MVRHQDGPGAEGVELVHDVVGLDARHHDAHGDPAALAQRRHRRRLETRGDAGGRVDQLGGQVVVHQHVLVGDHDPLQPAPQGLEPGHVGGRGDEHRGRLQDHGTEHLEPLLTQGRSGLDDVGHGIRDTQPHRGLHRAIEPHDRGRDALAAEEVGHQPVVARRHAQRPRGRRATRSARSVRRT